MNSPRFGLAGLDHYIDRLAEEAMRDIKAMAETARKSINRKLGQQLRRSLERMRKP